MYYSLHICNPRKDSFEGQIHVIAQYLLGAKFDKDGSVHTFARISKGRAKTVITVFALVAIKVQI